MNNKEKYEELWKKLPTSVDANLQFAELVMNREPHNTRYFFDEYSHDIIKWIALNLYKDSGRPVEELILHLYSQYYEFVIKPLDDFKNPGWYQLKSYKGLNGMKLKSWLMKNAIRYFARKRYLEKTNEKNDYEMSDFKLYETLLIADDHEGDLSDEDLKVQTILNKALKELSERDQTVINCLILSKMHWEDAFEELKDYWNPRQGKDSMLEWSDKQKQDALSQLKKRAKENLVKKFKKLSK